MHSQSVRFGERVGGGGGVGGGAHRLAKLQTQTERETKGDRESKTYKQRCRERKGERKRDRERDTHTHARAQREKGSRREPPFPPTKSTVLFSSGLILLTRHRFLGRCLPDLSVTSKTGRVRAAGNRWWLLLVVVVALNLNRAASTLAEETGWRD